MTWKLVNEFANTAPYPPVGARQAIVTPRGTAPAIPGNRRTGIGRGASRNPREAIIICTARQELATVAPPVARSNARGVSSD
jgi:hypothetical protein